MPKIAPLINRDNYHLTLAYLKYLEEVRQNDRLTVVNRRMAMRHQLEWAADRPFIDAEHIRPTFPRYLLSADLNGDGKPISPGYAVKVCRVVQDFMRWYRRSDKAAAKAIPESWIETVTIARTESAVHESEYYTLDEVRQLLAVPAQTRRIERDQAAVAFLFLSGMRVGAFVSMRIEALMLAGDHPYVRQYPELGMKTKNRKAADTWLWLIPDLLERVRAWDSTVRSTLSTGALWYATLDTWGKLTGGDNVDSDRRRSVSDGLRDLCQRAGVRYKSVHKLRHGITVYGWERASSAAEMKAISQNLMHSSMGITDAIYSVLKGSDVGAQIAALSAKAMGGKNGPAVGDLPVGLSDREDMARVLESLAHQLRKG